MPEPGQRTNAVLSKLSLAGDLLMLQLVFALLSLGIVTLVPAAGALQRVLPLAIGQEHGSLLRRFWSEFAWAFRRFWAAGLGLVAGGFALTFGLLFWASTTGPIRIFALAVLIPLTGLVTGLYLSALATLPTAAPKATPKTVFRSASRFLFRRPLPVAGVVVALFTWFLLLGRLPTLFLVGSGLVPALLAYWISDRPAPEPSEEVAAPLSN